MTPALKHLLEKDANGNYYCPLCDSLARQLPTWRIQCDEENGICQACYISFPKEKWNTRAYLPVITEMLDVIRKQREALVECHAILKHDGFGGVFEKDEAPVVDRALEALALSAPYAEE